MARLCRRCHLAVKVFVVRRLITLFLLLLMPLQFGWAAMGAYCEHETGGAAWHLGHHEHQHRDADTVAPDGDGDGDASGAYHADCESCHLASGAPLPASDHKIAASPTGETQGDRRNDYRSHIPSGLERPDRTERIAAARFGGVVAFGPNSA